MLAAVTEFKMTADSLDQFDRAVSLHGAASRAGSASIQLLNLWAALEAVVPVCVRGAKIKSVIGALKPFIRLQYSASLIDDLLADLYRYDIAALKDALRAVGKAGRRQGREGLVMVLFSPEHHAAKDELLKKIAGYSLLVNRIHGLAERFKDSQRVRRTLDAHDQRIEWQLRRIYRTRNLYVHSGKKVELLDNLVENAHCYLDAYLNVLFLLTQMAPPMYSLDQAWLVATERSREWDSALQGRDAYSTSNVCALVLGPVMNRV